jgi:hypothetical protein
MSSETLERRFATVGACVTVAHGPWQGEPRIDVRTDARGEYFDVRFAGGERTVELEVVDVQPRDRHLLLVARAGRADTAKGSVPPPQCRLRPSGRVVLRSGGGTRPSGGARSTGRAACRAGAARRT